ncbi:MAG TPA: peptidyl-prolyl cis-trans isomerase [Acidobacteriota bacterium]
MTTLLLLFALAGATAASTGERIVARTRGGAVTQSELESYRRHRTPLRRPQAQKRDRKSDLERLVVLRALSQQARDQKLDQQPRHAAELRLLRQELAAGRLEQELRARSRPADHEVEAYFQQHANDFNRPRRWRLSNIFKKLAPDAGAAQREAARAELERIRARLQAGEDFAELARQSSDSASRSYGGRIGVASRAELHPQIAAVVAEMKPGDLSEVIETEDGLTLVLCTGVLEPVVKSLTEARDPLRRALSKQAFEDRWAELTQELRRRHVPSFDAKAAMQGKPESALILYHRSGAEATLGRRDYEVFLDRRELDATDWSERQHAAQLETRFLLVARELEAERQGLLDSSEFEDLLVVRTMELLAEIAAQEQLAPEIQLPAPDEIRAYYLRHRDAFIEPARFQIRALKLRLDRSLGRDLYQHFEQEAEAAQRGEIGLAQIAKKLDPAAQHTELVDYGWLTERQVAALGLAVKLTVDGLKPGAISPILQDRHDLLLVELLASKPEQPMPRAAAERWIAERLKRTRYLDAKSKLEAEVLAAQALVVEP